MTTQMSNESLLLRNSERFKAAKKELLASISEASKRIDKVRPALASSQEARDQYTALVKDLGKARGRDLYFPFVGGGLGKGPLVELADGSVKFDMITGIGINFFGHSHPALMDEAVDSVVGDIMQGNLEPATEMLELLQAVLSRTGPDCRLKHGWLMCSGTMANEVALKIIRQKKSPATKVFAFKDCFAGRSTTMQEITDNPGYRQGQPVYGEVCYLPFYDPKLGLQESIEATLSVLKENLVRYPDRFVSLMIELVQGEGGFCFAPREYYVRLFEEVKKAGLAIWVDEIQTFGRTGELFAFQKFGLGSFVDVVTVGKMLQACMVLYTDEFNPKPGLVAGTFAGSTVALRTARRTVELLDQGGFLGPQGTIEKLSARFVSNLDRLAQGTCKGFIRETRAIGGMIAFSPFSGSMEDVKVLLFKLFDIGVVAFYCGHGPYLVRMLPPLGAMKESDVDEVCHLIETAILDVAKQKQVSR